MSDVIIYKSENNQIEVSVQLDKETVWLNQSEITALFERDQSVISRHINNVFKENELDKKSNMQKMHIANSDKPVSYYSLDVIISVGFRVNSKKGTQFRIWANKILKDYLVKGYAINEKRLQQSEKQLAEFKRLAQLQAQIIEEFPLATNETKGLIQVIANYVTALSYSLIRFSNGYQQLSNADLLSRNLYFKGSYRG